MVKNMMGALHKKWLDLPKNYRTGIPVVLFMAGFMAVGAFLSSEPRARAPKEKGAQVSLASPRVNVESVEGVSKDTAMLRRELDGLRSQFRDLKELNERLVAESDSKKEPQGGGASEDLVAELEALRGQLRSGANFSDRPGLPGGGKAPGLNAAIGAPVKGGSAEDLAALPEPAAEVEPPKPMIRVTGTAREVKKDPSKNDSFPPIVVPSTSMFEGVTLTGMVAPTSGVGEKNPIPTVIRIKSLAFLPNYAQQDIRECFVLAGGFGVLGAERIKLRTEKISCVREDGKWLESPMDGYISGEDSLEGLSGRVVSKQGQMIAKALVSGVFSGAAESLSPSRVPRLNLGSTGIEERTSLGDIAQSSVGRGLSEASKAVSQFYLNLAEQIPPSIEVGANRKVTIVLINGLTLK